MIGHGDAIQEEIDYEGQNVLISGFFKKNGHNTNTNLIEHDDDSI